MDAVLISNHSFLRFVRVLKSKMILIVKIDTGIITIL